MRRRGPDDERFSPRDPTSEARGRTLAVAEADPRSAAWHEERLAFPTNAAINRGLAQLVRRLDAPREVRVTIRAGGVAGGEAHQARDAFARDGLLLALVATRHAFARADLVNEGKGMKEKGERKTGLRAPFSFLHFPSSFFLSSREAYLAGEARWPRLCGRRLAVWRGTGNAVSLRTQEFESPRPR